MWKKARDLVGEGSGKARLVMMGFERASSDAIEGAFRMADLVGCYSHLCQSIWRRPHGLGLAAKCSADDDFKLMVKKLTPLAFFSLDRIEEGFGLLER